MYYPGPEDTYGQERLPYQPYRENISSSYLQAQQFTASPPTPQARIASGTRATWQDVPSKLRMSKAEALALVDTYKRWLVVGSVVAFGFFSFLVGGNLVGHASQPVNPASNDPTNSPSSNGNFLQQQGGSQFGGDNSWQQPVSGSHAS